MAYRQNRHDAPPACRQKTAIRFSPVQSVFLRWVCKSPPCVRCTWEQVEPFSSKVPDTGQERALRIPQLAVSFASRQLSLSILSCFSSFFRSRIRSATWPICSSRRALTRSHTALTRMSNVRVPARPAAAVAAVAVPVVPDTAIPSSNARKETGRGFRVLFLFR